MLYCIVLYCIVMYCTVLYCTVLYSRSILLCCSLLSCCGTLVIRWRSVTLYVTVRYYILDWHFLWSNIDRILTLLHYIINTVLCITIQYCTLLYFTALLYRCARWTVVTLHSPLLQTICLYLPLLYCMLLFPVPHYTTLLCYYSLLSSILMYLTFLKILQITKFTIHLCF